MKLRIACYAVGLVLLYSLAKVLGGVDVLSNHIQIWEGAGFVYLLVRTEMLHIKHDKLHERVKENVDQDH